MTAYNITAICYIVALLKPSILSISRFIELKASTLIIESASSIIDVYYLSKLFIISIKSIAVSFII